MFLISRSALRCVFVLSVLSLPFFVKAQSWTAKATMSVGRAQLGAAYSSITGYTYVFGGYNTSTNYTSMEVYNPTTNSWSAGATPPSGLRGPAFCTGSDNNIYYGGGYNGSTSSQWYRYNVAAGNWSTLTSLPTAVWEAGTASYNGKVYVAGGESFIGGTAALQIYDIATNTWTTGASMPAVRELHGMVATPSGKLYVFGGVSYSAGPVQSSIFCYDIATNSWTTLTTTLPTAMAGCGAAYASSGKVYLVGGKQSYYNNTGPFLTSCYIFEPATNSISTGTSLNVASGEHALVATPNGLYCIGGLNGGTSVFSSNLLLDNHTISTSAISATSFCTGNTISVPFASTGVYNTGNVYTAQLSDASGSFAMPITIGTVSSTSNTGSVSALIPASTPAGTGYRVRVVSSNPAIVGTDNGSGLSIDSTVNPAVSITANVSGTICSGTSVLFTGSALSGGNAPQYQWLRNGSNAGSTTLSYTSATLANGDVMQLRMISNAVCRSADTVFSNLVSTSVNAVPSVNSSSSVNPASCGGNNGSIALNGLAPSTSYTISFAKNGTAQAARTITSNSSGVVTMNGLYAGSYSAIVVSSGSCSSSPVGPITLSDPPTPAAPTVTSNLNVCQGANLNLNANGQGGATYNWTGPATFSSAQQNPTLASMQSGYVGTYSVTQTVAGCTSAAATTSVTMSLAPAQPGPINGDSSFCAGNTELYHIAPVSGATSYSWTFPASWTGHATMDSLVLMAGSGSGAITVTPIGACGAGPSRSLSVNANPIATTAVTLARSSVSDTVCSGVPVTFTANATGSGNTPQYIFRKNGNVVYSSGNSYTDYNLANGDVIAVTMISSLPCVTQVQVSDSVSMTVMPGTVPGININATPVTSLCAGTPLTFATNIVGGGSTPAYQWYLNGKAISGATAPTFTTATLSSNDSLQVTLISSQQCRALAVAYSNKVGIRINPIVTTSVSISTSSTAPSPYVGGLPLTFSATSSGGGDAPVYQWMLNGIELASETGMTYTTSRLKTGDRVSVRMLSSEQCASPGVVKSNEIVVEGATSVSSPIASWKGNVVLYPNPSSGHFTIAVNWDASHIGKRVAIDIVSALGQGVYHSELQPQAKEWSTEVWLPWSIANGTYLVRVVAEDGMHSNLPVLLAR